MQKCFIQPLVTKEIEETKQVHLLNENVIDMSKFFCSNGMEIINTQVMTNRERYVTVVNIGIVLVLSLMPYSFPKTGIRVRV